MCAISNGPLRIDGARIREQLRPATHRDTKSVRWPVSRVLCLRDEAKRWPFLWDDDCSPPHATHPDGDPETDHVPSLFGLAPGGACLATSVARDAVRSYRTISTLLVFAPSGASTQQAAVGLPGRSCTATKAGGIISVALSLRSPWADVIRHRVSVEPGLSSPNLASESGHPAI